jgi:hypothetical protein
VIGVILTEDQIGRILQDAEHALSSYATADGRVTFRLSAHLVTANKPLLRGAPSNNSMQLTALRAAADAGRWVAKCR